MGVGVSNWCLANAVSRNGQIGVVSGTALDTVFVRRLQNGDIGGHLRRAISHFPWPEMAKRVLDRFFIPEGKNSEKRFKLPSMPNLRMKSPAKELLILANFVEVFLAKEGHRGLVGINFLEKIQLPTLPSLLGAMLAGGDFVLMGAGIPLAIPGILDGLSQWQPVEYRIAVEDNAAKETFAFTFDPTEHVEGIQPALGRPKFLAIISSDILAKTFVRRASGYTDGFIVENYTAGGHNAPPRRVDRSKPATEEYTEKDIADLAQMREIGRPFYLAGGFASPEAVQSALKEGAAGVQLGTIFAYSQESGIRPDIKRAVIEKYFRGELTVNTDFRASPTGFPFKTITLDNSVTNPAVGKARGRICDLGYLRNAYVQADGKVGYRCASEPIDQFVQKGGAEEETTGRHCLCNGLMATIGLGQVRDEGTEPPIITSGDDFSFLDHIIAGKSDSYTALDVLNYLTNGKAATNGKAHASEPTVTATPALDMGALPG